MRFMRQMAGKDEETSLEDSSFGPGHFRYVETESKVKNLGLGPSLI